MNWFKRKEKIVLSGEVQQAAERYVDALTEYFAQDGAKITQAESMRRFTRCSDLCDALSEAVFAARGQKKPGRMGRP